MSGAVFYCAPLEGLTSFVFRRAHAKYFPGVQKYYSPFLAPAGDGLFSKRERRDVRPENNEGVNLVPQLLVRNPQDFIRGARELQQMGWTEINLNLGCPSGTVFSKGKGAGFLAHPEELDAFLDRVFSALDCRVSVKTRLGVSGSEEFYKLLETYNKYPIYELTVHARVRTDFYKLPVRSEYFAYTLENSRAPVCVNGDLINPSDIARLLGQLPECRSVMLGRGLCADPALVIKAQGGAVPDRERFVAFHDEIFCGYTEAFGAATSAMARMKELWFYLINLFDDSKKYSKRIKKTTDPGDYLLLAHEVIRRLDMLPEVRAQL